MRLGPLLGFEQSFDTVVTVAQEMEAVGAGSVMLAEAGRSAVTQAAAVIAATKSIEVGTYVANAFARSPWLTGLTARDLDEMSGGIDSSKALTAMRDFVEIVRQVIAAPVGSRVSYEGPVHQVKKWRASFAPYRDSVPVYLSASGPKMMQVAAEVSDGIGVGIMASVEFMRDTVRPNAFAAAQSVGREPEALAFPMGALVSVNQNSELARNAAKASVCGLFHPVPHPYYDSQMRQQGFSETADRLAELMPQGKTAEAMRIIPEEVIDTLTISGTPAECARRIAEYEGVTEQIVMMRVAQKDEALGVHAYEPIFELISETKSS
ncbi:MAG: LLM class flavin-dependent oxidoreductase [Acidimicrobiales bacterium]